MASYMKLTGETDGNWTPYHVTCLLIEQNRVSEALRNVIGKGELKITTERFHQKTAEITFDTTYPMRMLAVALMPFPAVKLRRL